MNNPLRKLGAVVGVAGVAGLVALAALLFSGQGQPAPERRYGGTPPVTIYPTPETASETALATASETVSAPATSVVASAATVETPTERGEPSIGVVVYEAQAGGSGKDVSPVVYTTRIAEGPVMAAAMRRKALAQRYEIPEAMDVFPSPDGKRVALVRYVEAGDVVDIVTVESGEIEPLFKRGVHGIGLFFRWESSNRYVAFYADALYVMPGQSSDLRGGLWVIDVDTGAISQETWQWPTRPDGIKGQINSAAVSPDGRRVVYSVEGWGGTVSGLWLANRDGTDAHVILTGTGGIDLAWSPDGRQIAFANAGLNVMNADGTGLRRLEGGISHALFFPMAWSPDGRMIAVQPLEDVKVEAGKGDLAYLEPARRNIQVVDVETGKARRLLPEHGNYDPAWSPDSRQLAFMSVRSGRPEVWVMGADGAGLRQVTSGIPASARRPFWHITR